MNTEEVKIWMEAGTQIHRFPWQLICTVAGLRMSPAMHQGENATDEDPPEWARREEGWTIDELLGRYTPHDGMVTIFNKGIQHAATQLSVSPLNLEYVVRLHEWGHSFFHLGVDEKTAEAVGRAFVADDHASLQTRRQTLTDAFLSVEPYVHEQIAQSLTYLALEMARNETTAEMAKAVWDRRLEAFDRLMRRQPREYRVDQLIDLGHAVLVHRLPAAIDLIREGRVKGDMRTWDTVLTW